MTPPSSHLHLRQWLVPAHAEKATAIWTSIPKIRPLATICYGSVHALQAQFDMMCNHFGQALPCQLVNTPPIGPVLDSPPQCLWQMIYSRHAPQMDQHGLIHYSSDDDFIFGLAKEPAPSSLSLEEKSFEVYRQIFNFLHQHQDFKLWRIWNYLPRINQIEGGVERYWQFNAGRLRSFQQHFPHQAQKNLAFKPETLSEKNATVTLGIPAACGVGTMSEGATGTPNADLTVAFLASRLPFTQIENPRQMSAYQYPDEYGSSSPIFSRAIMASLPPRATPEDDALPRPPLFISGTSSIIGHRTCHVGDVAKQCLESLHNLDVVLQEANRLLAADKMTQNFYTLADLNFLVYLRNPQDYAQVHTLLSKKLTHCASLRYVQADVCRADLLIEIEATAL